MERFKLLKVGDKWTCTDLLYQIVCSFDENNFNDSQHFDLPNDIMDGKSANDLARIINEMGKWLHDHHYSLIMPREQPLREIIGANVRDLRKRKGISQTELAEMTGLTQSHINRIECAKYSTTIDVLDKVARALGAYIKFEDYNQP